MTVEGAAWVWPQRLDGVQPGDEVLVYADLPAAHPLRLSIAGKPVAASGALAPAPRPLLERAWVKARLARLMSQRDAASASDPDLAEALRKQVIDLSVRHRVLSPFTALLVLETENDYRRFGIDRRALADILTVGPAGIEVLDRHGIPSIATPAGPALGMDVPAERALRPGAPADKALANRACATTTSWSPEVPPGRVRVEGGGGRASDDERLAARGRCGCTPAARRRAGSGAFGVAALVSVATEEEDSVEGGCPGGVLARRAGPPLPPAPAARARRRPARLDLAPSPTTRSMGWRWNSRPGAAPQSPMRPPPAARRPTTAASAS